LEENGKILMMRITMNAEVGQAAGRAQAIAHAHQHKKMMG